MTTFYSLPAVGSEIKLHTHLVVREDAHSLFGFATESDRSLFRSLIKINGVGPKLALTILSGLSADEFNRCIRDNDAASLVRLPGVGKKTAERLLIEMRDRLPGFSGFSTGSSEFSELPGHIPVNAKQEAISALCSLGYKPLDATKMVQRVDTDDKSSEEIIRSALQGAGR